MSDRRSGGGGGEGARLRRVYEKLYAWAGPRHWWPAETPFEVIVGAILTQSVAWRNVETAIANLKAAGLLDPWALHRAEPEAIEGCIIPTRFYKAKAKKLKAFMAYFCERYGGDLGRLFAGPQGELRQELLAVHGLGPETVDSILLYAGGYPVFVVDAYTRRIGSRLGLFPEKVTYQVMQDYFARRLPAETPLFNEYHAQLDGLGHRLCRTQAPRCGECPLVGECPTGRQGSDGAPPAGGRRRGGGPA